jgi:hypothetical protein
MHSTRGNQAGLTLLATEFFRAKQHALAHDFAGFELNSGTRWDYNVVLGFVWIAAYAGFSEANFENAEVAQLNITTSRQSVCDAIQSELNDTEDFLLSESGFFADLHYQIPFGEVSHIMV